MLTVKRSHRVVKASQIMGMGVKRLKTLVPSHSSPHSHSHLSLPPFFSLSRLSLTLHSAVVNRTEKIGKEKK